MRSNSNCLQRAHRLLYVTLSLSGRQVGASIGRQGRRSGNNVGAINEIRGIVSNDGELVEGLRKCGVHGWQITY
jgi:hypothetical protein